ncbi:MAG: class II glutamine amidotransferase [Wenzhouxiangellaceae bacterium]|nr:class II glutamine amidotransferase [Wenzhouxiangellaceae bacterium]
MCRFTLYMGQEIPIADLVTRPENSLIHQSTHARERPEPLNGDGFGLAWYVADEPTPARFRALTPAWSNANLAELARVTHSRCILAHIRAATSGTFDVSEANCHPFRCGRFAFMHNGDIPAFDKIRRPLMQGLSDQSFALVRGTTDSEHMFALAMEHLRGHEQDSSCELLAEALEKTVSSVLDLIDEHAPGTYAYLNLVISDGRNAATCRFSSNPDYIDSLYINQGGRYYCEGKVCAMTDPEDEPGEDQRAILISSEPLNTGPRWQAIEKNHVALVSSDLSVKMRELERLG